MNFVSSIYFMILLFFPNFLVNLCLNFKVIIGDISVDFAMFYFQDA